MIDECFSSESYQFKLLMQTEKEFSNLIDDFFKYKYYMVKFFSVILNLIQSNRLTFLIYLG